MQCRRKHFAIDPHQTVIPFFLIARAHHILGTQCSLSDVYDAFGLGPLAVFCFCFSLIDFSLAAFCWAAIAIAKCQSFSAPTQQNLLLLL